MNDKLKAVFGSFIDKSLLKCLVVNDNVNNVKLSYDVIFYVTLFVAAIFISPVFHTNEIVTHFLKTFNCPFFQTSCIVQIVTELCMTPEKDQ